MSQTGNEAGWRIEGRSLVEIMDAALRRVVMREDGAGDEGTSFGLIFSGEGALPEDALLAALDDIREQCLDQGGVPIEIETSGVMATDAGTRVWGTVTAVPGTADAQRGTSTSRITIQEGEEGRWTLTSTTE